METKSGTLFRFMGLLLVGLAMVYFSGVALCFLAAVLITSLRGLILNGATAIAIMALHSLSGGLVFLAGGLLMGPAYKLGRILPVIPLFNDGTVAAHENETSEILFGLLTSVILILSMLV